MEGERGGRERWRERRMEGEREGEVEGERDGGREGEREGKRKRNSAGLLAYCKRSKTGDEEGLGTRLRITHS